MNESSIDRIALEFVLKRTMDAPPLLRIFPATESCYSPLYLPQSKARVHCEPGLLFFRVFRRSACRAKVGGEDEEIVESNLAIAIEIAPGVISLLSEPRAELIRKGQALGQIGGQRHRSLAGALGTRSLASAYRRIHTRIAKGWHQIRADSEEETQGVLIAIFICGGQGTGFHWKWESGWRLRM